MRTYNTQHKFYCGVDLHARSIFVNILDDKGTTRLEQDLPASPNTFLDAIKPFRDTVRRPGPCGLSVTHIVLVNHVAQ